MSAAQLLLLKQGPARPDHIPDGSPDPSLDDPESGRKLVCSACGHEITRSGARMSVDGSHKHVFSNPAGYVFEIGCFRTAPGCAHQGPPSPDFTWFPGFSWQVAVCSRCGILLGWRYRPIPGGETGFHGLILSHLDEISDAE